MPMENLESLKKKNRFLIALMLVVFFFTCVFATLFYYRFTYESNPIIITTKNLKIESQAYGLKDNTDIDPTTWSDNMEDNDNNINIAKVNLRVVSNSRIDAVYKVNMKSKVTKNDKYNAFGEISDIKYKVYKGNEKVSEGSFDSELDVKIIDGSMNSENDLLDEYKIYVYIEETGKNQDDLMDIKFDFNFVTEANQVEV